VVSIVNSVGGDGIREELRDMAFDDGVPGSEFDSAMQTAEQWRDALEGMAEVANVKERAHVTALWTSVAQAITDLLAASMPAKTDS